MVTRYLMSSYCLHANNCKTYFHFDIVMESVHRRSNFDKIAFLLVSFLIVYCMMVHYIREYCTDFRILDQQYQAIVQSCVQFSWHYPEFKVNFSNRNVLKTCFGIMVKVVKLFRCMKTFKKQNQNNKKNNVKLHAQLVLFAFTIELINMIFFILLSK